MYEVILNELYKNTFVIVFNNRWKSTDPRFNFYRQMRFELLNSGEVKANSTYWFKDGQTYYNYLCDLFRGVKLVDCGRVEGWIERYTYMFPSISDFERCFS